MSAQGAIVLGTHIAALSAGWRALESERRLNAAIDEAVSLRYQLLEIPLLDPNIAPSNLAATAKGKSLRIWYHLALPAACHLPARPELARHWLGKALDFTEASGGSFLCGALGWSVGVLTEPEQVETQRTLIVEVLGDLAQEAQRRGIHLALEPANRYETSLCNTLADGVDLIERIGAPNLYLLANTQHMHMEESSVSEGLGASREALCAVHLGENTGGRLGSGAFPWAECWQTLSDARFDGALIVTPQRRVSPTSAGEAERSAATQALPFLRTAVRAIQSPPTRGRFEPAVSASLTLSVNDPLTEKKSPTLRKHPNTKSYRRRT
jgi:D-psicose/D-tagatose/L-ribulose 3-epimerase